MKALCYTLDYKLHVIYLGVVIGVVPSGVQNRENHRCGGAPLRRAGDSDGHCVRFLICEICDALVSSNAHGAMDAQQQENQASKTFETVPADRGPSGVIQTLFQSADADGARTHDSDFQVSICFPQKLPGS